MSHNAASRTSIAEQDGIAHARRDAVAARSAWVDAVAALMIGAAAASALTSHAIAIAAAIGLFVASLVLLHRFTPKRGRLTDERAVKAQFLVFPACFLVIFLVSQLAAEPGTSWWWLVLAGIAMTGAGFTYLRLDERYQTRRLASGDYGPYDLT